MFVGEENKPNPNPAFSTCGGGGGSGGRRAGGTAAALAPLAAGCCACSLGHHRFRGDPPARAQLPPAASPRAPSCLRWGKQRGVWQFSAYSVSGRLAGPAAGPGHIFTSPLRTGCGKNTRSCLPILWRRRAFPCEVTATGGQKGWKEEGAGTRRAAKRCSRAGSEGFWESLPWMIAGEAAFFSEESNILQL